MNRKQTTLCLIVFWNILCSQGLWAQTSCEQKLKDAVAAERQGEYLDALNKYNAARKCDRNLEADIDVKITAMFQKIEKLRKSAINARDEAEKARKKAVVAQQEAERQRALTQQVIDRIYFYQNRFGLAFDRNSNRYGFIDRYLNIKIPFLYESAASFDESTGFAQVRNEMGNFLIDTSGQTYSVRYDIVSMDSTIEALDLRNRNLFQVPTLLAEYAQLKILILGNNQLVNLPTAFTQLKQLQVLILFNNNFTQLSPSIGQFSQLKSLDLYGNGMVRLPKEIGQLRQLNALDLSFNQLQQLPSEIGQLSSLEVLLLPGNQIETLPESIKQLSKLKYLDLSGNAKITKNHLKEIGTWLPNCKIVW